MSTICTSSRSRSFRQSVSAPAQPSFAAAAAVRSFDRPERTTIEGFTGRSKNADTLRHACECTRPMNAYPTMAIPSGGL